MKRPLITWCRVAAAAAFAAMPSILLRFNFAFNFNLGLYVKEGAEPEPEREKFDRHAPRARRCKLTRRNQMRPILKAPALFGST